MRVREVCYACCCAVAQFMLPVSLLVFWLGPLPCLLTSLMWTCLICGTFKLLPLSYKPGTTASDKGIGPGTSAGVRANNSGMGDDTARQFPVHVSSGCPSPDRFRYQWVRWIWRRFRQNQSNFELLANNFSDQTPPRLVTFPPSFISPTVRHHAAALGSVQGAGMREQVLLHHRGTIHGMHVARSLFPLAGSVVCFPPGSFHPGIVQPNRLQRSRNVDGCHSPGQVHNCTQDVLLPGEQ